MTWPAGPAPVAGRNSSAAMASPSEASPWNRLTVPSATSPIALASAAATPRSLMGSVAPLNGVTTTAGVVVSVAALLSGAPPPGSTAQALAARTHPTAAVPIVAKARRRRRIARPCRRDMAAKEGKSAETSATASSIVSYRFMVGSLRVSGVVGQVGEVGAEPGERAGGASPAGGLGEIDLGGDLSDREVVKVAEHQHRAVK